MMPARQSTVVAWQAIMALVRVARIGREADGFGTAARRAV